MSLDEIAVLTGLNREEAELARQRDYSEPFVFPGAPEERFLQAIEGGRLRWTQGQFFHLMGNHHKGRAVDILRTMYKRAHGSVTSVGIGDSLNDLPFLLSVDKPVLVKKKSGKHDARIDIPGLLRTQGKGPEGWNQAVLELLKS
jgi:mannosyl-3-phosphoglycerate phosphatase